MKKVLIVEDDFYIRDLYTKSFRDAGYDVELAVDGEEAITKVKNQTYDIILLDIMLPRVTGIDVLKSYRAAGSTVANTPVFMITNLGQEDIIKDAFKIGADGYLIKAQLAPKDVVSEINAFFAEQDKIKQPPTSTASSPTPSTQAAANIPPTNPTTTSPGSTAPPVTNSPSNNPAPTQPSTPPQKPV